MDLALIIAVVIGLKGFIAGSMALIKSFMDRTSSDLDNRIYGILEKIHKFLALVK